MLQNLLLTSAIQMFLDSITIFLASLRCEANVLSTLEPNLALASSPSSRKLETLL